VAEVPVFHEGRRVGTVDICGDGPSFSYDRRWLDSPDAFPISLQMPLSPDPTPPGLFERWACGLLPSGPRLAGLALKLGLAPNDTIGILARVGRDTAGALTFAEPGSAGPTDQTEPVLEEPALQRLLDDLPATPPIPGDDPPSALLSGGRCKLSLAIDAQGRMRLPRAGAPSTHILKPDAEHLFGGVQNEALATVLARRCGLAAPAVTTGIARGRAYLLLQRYDRIERDGRWHRLHQETFAQALGAAASPQPEAQPTLAEAIALARQHMCARDVLALIDAIIFDALICNPDSGAGSLSLIISHDGISLAPMHGLACVAAWDGISPKLGRMIAGAHIGADEWQALAADCGLNAGRLLARLAELAEAVLAHAREAAEAVAAMPAGPHPLLARLVMAIETRARRHRAVAQAYRACSPRRAVAGRDHAGPMLSVAGAGG
jgi:serine/threonine-protein kinase HipA